MGPKTTFMTACSSGATAIGFTRDLIAGGAATVMLAGGVEPLSQTTYATFNALQAVDPEFCKPFDRKRQGLSLGEAAAMLVLESLTHARQRGARIYGEVLGYGVTCDAHHMTAPDPEASITSTLTAPQPRPTTPWKRRPSKRSSERMPGGFRSVRPRP
jgi:3-oxoacyl-[acyl-carrier-protein] synthase II